MHQYSRGSARAPELIKISIAGLASAVLADENCRIWVMQQITIRLIEFGRLAAESRERRGLGKPETFNFLTNDWLAKPRILHPWPQARFAVTHPRWEAVCGNPARTDLYRGRSAMRVP